MQLFTRKINTLFSCNSLRLIDATKWGIQFPMGIILSKRINYKHNRVDCGVQCQHIFTHNESRNSFPGVREKSIPKSTSYKLRYLGQAAKLFFLPLP